MSEVTEYAFWEAHSIGAKEARKGIVELLEKQMADCCSYGPSQCMKCSVVAESIALIKGETE